MKYEWNALLEVAAKQRWEQWQTWIKKNKIDSRKIKNVLFTSKRAGLSSGKVTAQPALGPGPCTLTKAEKPQQQFAIAARHICHSSYVYSEKSYYTLQKFNMRTHREKDSIKDINL